MGCKARVLACKPAELLAAAPCELHALGRCGWSGRLARAPVPDLLGDEALELLSTRSGELLPNLFVHYAGGDPLLALGVPVQSLCSLFHEVWRLHLAPFFSPTMLTTSAGGWVKRGSERAAVSMSESANFA